MNNNNLKSAGVTLLILIFLLIVIALHIVQTDYNPVHQLMSELALGKFGNLMLFAFFSFSMAVFLTQQSLTVYESCLIVRIMLLTASLSLANAGMLKLDQYPTLHVLFMAVAFILIVLSMYLLPRMITQFKQKAPTIICWGLGICTTLTIAIGGLYIPIGIAQRLAASSIFIWLIWLAIFNKNQLKKSNTTSLLQEAHNNKD